MIIYIIIMKLILDVINDDNDNNDDNNEIYEENDLVICKTPDGQIRSCGFSINNLLLREGKSPMMTINHSNYNDDHDKYNDNKYNETQNVSDLFRHLAVPAGFFYIQSKNIPMKNNYIEEENDLEEDLYDKLLALASTNNREFKKKSTRKNNLKKIKNKTHRNTAF